MQVTVNYMAQLRRLAGKANATLDVPAGCTVAQLLVRLARDTANLGSLLVDAHGRPQPSLLVFVGEEQVTAAGTRLVQEGDVVTLLTPMSGGATS